MEETKKMETVEVAEVALPAVGESGFDQPLEAIQDDESCGNGKLVFGLIAAGTAAVIGAVMYAKHKKKKKLAQQEELEAETEEEEDDSIEKLSEEDTEEIPKEVETKKTDKK